MTLKTEAAAIHAVHAIAKARRKDTRTIRNALAYHDESIMREFTALMASVVIHSAQTSAARAIAKKRSGDAH
jgi:hypothetical protein